MVEMRLLEQACRQANAGTSCHWKKHWGVRGPGTGDTALEEHHRGDPQIVAHTEGRDAPPVNLSTDVETARRVAPALSRLAG